MIVTTFSRLRAVSRIAQRCALRVPHRVVCRPWIIAADCTSGSPETTILRSLHIDAQRLRAVACSGETGHHATLQTVLSALTKAEGVWEKYDNDGSGAMSLKECQAMLNCGEISEALLHTANIPARTFSAEDLQPYFQRADKDHNDTISRSEFLALSLAVLFGRIKKNPLLLAEALLGFIDKDKNGVLEGAEVRSLLAILGFPAALLAPLPSYVQLHYRDILERLGAKLEGTAATH